MTLKRRLVPDSDTRQAIAFSGSAAAAAGSVNLTAHVAAADPHVGYTTTARATAIALAIAESRAFFFSR